MFVNSTSVNLNFLNDLNDEIIKAAPSLLLFLSNISEKMCFCDLSLSI